MALFLVLPTVAQVVEAGTGPIRLAYLERPWTPPDVYTQPSSSAGATLADVVHFSMFLGILLGVLAGVAVARRVEVSGLLGGLLGLLGPPGWVIVLAPGRPAAVPGVP